MSGKTLRETLAAVGVMLSLLFVGLELRQNTLAVRATALNDLATGSREYLLTVGSNPDLIAARIRWIAGEELEPVEMEMTIWTLSALLRNMENVFLQVRAGAVDESALQSYGFSVALPFRSPHFAAMWASRRGGFHPDFVAAFEAQLGLTP